MIWLLCIIFANPYQARETVDAIELNHRYDECGNHCFSQLIFWDDVAGVEVVRDWRMHDKATLQWQLDKPVVRYFDSDAFVGREIVAERYKETWTQTDPERENQKVVRTQDRVGLCHPAQPAP